MKKAILTVFLAIAAILALIFVSCKKDRFEEPDSNQSTLSISVEEVRQILGDPSSGMVSSRSSIQVPLNFTPNWNNAILNTQTGIPLVVADVDTCCLPPNMPANGNLIFKKNNTGTIECSFMLWFKSPGSTYDDWRAPLWTQNTFSGLVVLVDAQDTIRRVASYVNGSINKVLVWNKNIRGLAEDEFGASSTVEDRGGPGGPKCPRWGRSIWAGIGDFLLEVIDGLGAFFNGLGSNNGNNPGTPSPYSFFFDFSSPTPWMWTTGVGGSETEFQRYRVDCGIAIQNFIANGFYPPEYAHLDMRLCELLSALYVWGLGDPSDFRLQCLYANHHSTYFEEIWQYWDESDKTQHARDVLNRFLNAACSEEPSVQKAAMLRYAYCLGNMNLVDMWDRLTTQCGPNFGLDISPCLAAFILNNAEASSSYQCANGMMGAVINFSRQHDLTPEQFVTLLKDEGLFGQVKAITEALLLNNAEVGWVISNPLHANDLDTFLGKYGNEEGAKDHANTHLDNLMADPEYRDMSEASFGWPGVLWTIAQELIGDALIDLLLNQIPFFNKQDEVRDIIKSAKNSSWLEFSYEVTKLVFKTVLKNNPYAKAVQALWEGSEKAAKIGKALHKVETLVGMIGAQAVERSWDILKKMGGKLFDIEDLPRYLKYIDDLKTPKLGGYFATVNTYSANFKNKFSDVKDQIAQVHHAVPQKVKNQYNLVNDNQLHSLENLRGIPSNDNFHQTLTNAWKGFFDPYDNAGTVPSLADIFGFYQGN